MRRSNISVVLPSVLALVAGTLLGGAVLAGCGEEDVPLRPTYSHDIQPLMEAHCIRCHGAGGTMNLDPDVPTDFKTAGGNPIGGTAPLNGDFTGLGAGPASMFGLMSYTDTGILKGATKTYLPYMPPPPSDPLTDRELTLLKRWLALPLP